MHMSAEVQGNTVFPKKRNELVCMGDDISFFENGMLKDVLMPCSQDRHMGFLCAFQLFLHPGKGPPGNAAEIVHRV